MASPSSKRQSRKRRKPSAGSGTGGSVRAAPGARSAASGSSPRPGLRAPRRAPAARDQGRHDNMLGTYGEPPPSPFGGLPISEVAILVGAIGVVVGLVSAAAPALIVGIIVCTLGVVEFSAREHFSGYRSHATMLAAIPAVLVGIGLIALLGGSLRRGPLLLSVVPVFAILFVLLRKRFRTARQARIARPPTP